MKFKYIIFLFLIFIFCFSFFFFYQKDLNTSSITEKKEPDAKIIEKMSEIEKENESLRNKIKESHINEGLLMDQTTYHVKRTYKKYDSKLKDLIASPIVEVRKYSPSNFTYGSQVLLDPVELNVSNTKNTFCVYDDFTTKLDGFNKSHGDLVVDLIMKYYKKDIYTVDMKKNEYNASTILQLSNCDILNFSFINEVQDKELEDFIYTMISFLDSRDVMIFASAGNDNNEESSNINANSKFKKDGYDGNLFIISQGRIENNKPLITQSFGEEVDFVVLNDELYYKGEPISGTSFAAPLASSLTANLLDYGLKKDQIKTVLTSNKTFKYKNTYYNTLLMKDSLSKANKILKK